MCFGLFVQIVIFLKGLSIINVNSEGEAGVHTSKRKVGYLELIGGPWRVKNLENELTSIMEGP